MCATAEIGEPAELRLSSSRDKGRDKNKVSRNARQPVLNQQQENKMEKISDRDVARYQSAFQ
jgi:hypothetical protein